MSVFRHINKVLIREKKWLPMDIDKILKETMNNSIPWQAVRLENYRLKNHYLGQQRCQV